MRVRNEDIVNLLQGNSPLLQLAQCAIATAGIHQKHAIRRAHGKTSVIAPRHGGITRSQHNQLCHGAMLAQTIATRKQNHPGHEKNK